MVNKDGSPNPLVKIMYNWKKLGKSAACCICDFIKLECLNVERYIFRNSKIRKLLKDISRSNNGFYIEIKTPIKKTSAAHRKKLLNLFPRSYRHMLIKEYEKLSGTDICLLLMAYYLTINKIMSKNKNNIHRNLRSNSTENM